MAALPPIATGASASSSPDRLMVAEVPAAVILAGVVELGERHHLPTARWLAGSGLDAELLRRPTTKVSFRQAAAILRRALRDFGVAPVGMTVGSRGALETFGILGPVMASCRTVGEAAALGIELQLSAGALMDFALEPTEADLVLRMRERSPEPALLPFLCEEAMTSTLLFWRTFVDESLNPAWVELAYPDPGYGAAYQRFFRCPIRFGAATSGMAFPESFFALPLLTHDPVRLATALERARALVDPRDVRPDLVMVVENLLSGSHGRPQTLEQVAGELGLSPRTLRRRLARAGASFASLRDDARRRRAVELLTRGLPVGEVAVDLGFSEAREFRRAFKRWTGAVPSSLHPVDD